jgi:undecaprenyl diphosphate synthase
LEGVAGKVVIPRHVAIMMDGNRRWAQARGLPAMEGHRQGAERLREVVEEAAAAGVQVLTVYAFSTENWNRSRAEVAGLFLLMEQMLEWKEAEMVEKGVRFHTIGDPTPLSKRLRSKIEQVQKATQGGDRIDLVVAINYGARDEMRRAVGRLMEQGIRPENLTEQQLNGALDTAPWGDPDLLIRTSGEQRLSNFLLWQLAYSEVYFTQTHWPEFTGERLREALADFQQRRRRYGT